MLNDTNTTIDDTIILNTEPNYDTKDNVSDENEEPDIFGENKSEEQEKIVENSTNDDEIYKMKEMIFNILVRLSNKKNNIKNAEENEKEIVQQQKKSYIQNVELNENIEIANWLNEQQEQNLQNILDIEYLKTNIKQKDEKMIYHFNNLFNLYLLLFIINLFIWNLLLLLCFTFKFI